MSTSREVKCLLCESADVVVYCEQCEGHLCEKCRSSHLNIPACRGHVFKSTESLEVKPECLTCHGSTVQYFCKNCDGSFCLKCKDIHDRIPLCKDHEIGPIDDSTETHRSNSRSTDQTPPTSKEKRQSYVGSLVKKFNSSESSSRSMDKKYKTDRTSRDNSVDEKNSGATDSKTHAEEKISSIDDFMLQNSFSKQMFQLFQSFDTNGDGVIDQDELRIALTILGKTDSDLDLKTTLEKMDQNKDGVVDIKEFMAIMS